MIAALRTSSGMEVSEPQVPVIFTPLVTPEQNEPKSLFGDRTRYVLGLVLYGFRSQSVAAIEVDHVPSDSSSRAMAEIAVQSSIQKGDSPPSWYFTTPAVPTANVLLQYESMKVWACMIIERMRKSMSSEVMRSSSLTSSRVQ